jgi:hypothetical protein
MFSEEESVMKKMIVFLIITILAVPLFGQGLNRSALIGQWNLYFPYHIEVSSTGVLQHSLTTKNAQSRLMLEKDGTGVVGGDADSAEVVQWSFGIRTGENGRIEFLTLDTSNGMAIIFLSRIDDEHLFALLRKAGDDREATAGMFVRSTVQWPSD